MLKPMDFILSAAVIIAVTFVAVSFARADSPLYILKDSNLNDPQKGDTGGLVINDLVYKAGIWTGWMRVRDMRSVCFDISTSEWSSSEDVSMRCESSESYNTTDDAGFDLMASSIAVTAGGSGAQGVATATSGILNWIFNIEDSVSFSWCVDNLPGTYLNCEFSEAANAGDAGDKLTVTARGVTP